MNMLGRAVAYSCTFLLLVRMSATLIEAQTPPSNPNGAKSKFLTCKTSWQFDSSLEAGICDGKSQCKMCIIIGGNRSTPIEGAQLKGLKLEGSECEGGQKEVDCVSYASIKGSDKLACTPAASSAPVTCGKVTQVECNPKKCSEVKNPDGAGNQPPNPNNGGKPGPSVGKPGGGKPQRK